MNKISCLLLSLLFVGFLSSCDVDDDATNNNEDAVLSLDIAYKVGEADFAYATTYDIDGTAVSFDFAQFYISGIEVTDEAMESNSFSDTYILAKPDAEAVELGNLDLDNIQMLNFNIGVDAATNSQSSEDFTNYEADNPLALQTPVSMHWNWNVGYIFLKINAMVDTDADGTPDTATEYHIGTDNFLTPVSVMIDETATEAGEKTIGLNFDIASLFTGIDLSTGAQTHTGDNPEMAQQIVANCASAFSKQ